MSLPSAPCQHSKPASGTKEIVAMKNLCWNSASGSCHRVVSAALELVDSSALQTSASARRLCETRKMNLDIIAKETLRSVLGRLGRFSCNKSWVSFVGTICSDQSPYRFGLYYIELYPVMRRLTMFGAYNTLPRRPGAQQHTSSNSRIPDVMLQ